MHGSSNLRIKIIPLAYWQAAAIVTFRAPIGSLKPTRISGRAYATSSLNGPVASATPRSGTLAVLSLLTTLATRCVKTTAPLAVHVIRLVQFDLPARVGRRRMRPWAREQ